MLKFLFHIIAIFRPATVKLAKFLRTPPVAASEVFCKGFVVISCENALFCVPEDSVRL